MYYCPTLGFPALLGMPIYREKRFSSIKKTNNAAVLPILRITTVVRVKFGAVEVYKRGGI
jgi:hypothetical protein